MVTIVKLFFIDVRKIVLRCRLPPHSCFSFFLTQTQTQITNYTAMRVPFSMAISFRRFHFSFLLEKTLLQSIPQFFSPKTYLKILARPARFVLKRIYTHIFHTSCETRW